MDINKLFELLDKAEKASPVECKCMVRKDHVISDCLVFRWVFCHKGKKADISMSVLTSEFDYIDEKFESVGLKIRKFINEDGA